MLAERLVMKPIIWIGSAFKDLLSFPESLRKDAGYQLHRLQAGLEAADWKPLSEIGRGVAEVRLRDESGAYRIVYLSRLEEAIYVLHCFNKKTQRMPQHDADIARQRLQTVTEQNRSLKWITRLIARFITLPQQRAIFLQNLGLQKTRLVA